MTLILRRRARRELEADEVARRAVAPGAGRDLGNRTRADMAERPRPLVGGATPAGQPLADEDQHDLGGSFGVDLSRAHVRPQDQSVSKRGARAETPGLAISFVPGAYTPHNLRGRGLLAHKVAHVLQQASAKQVVTALQTTPAAKVRKESKARLEEADADLVLLDDPADGCSARAWLRNGEVVLLEVASRTTAPAWLVDGLESPETRDDVVDGLVVVPSGEWVYPQRGLSVVTNQDGTAARHLFGFVSTTLDAYRRLLRPDLATVRRPAARMTGGDEL